MISYIPSTDKEVREMLDFIGVKDAEELFSDIADDLRLKGLLNLPEAKSEQEVYTYMKKLAKENISGEDYPVFFGGGAYDHLIPSVIPSIAGISEFYTSYTPYQPEVSQGTLQYIFEYQSMLSDLTGMDLSNASLYDGGTALMEAALLAVNYSKRKKILVSATVSPSYRTILNTYAHAQGIEVVQIPYVHGVTDLKALEELTDKDVAGVIVQSPNYFGFIEDIEKEVEITHRVKKVSFIQALDPLSLGILKRPGDMGVDIVVGEGQTLGMPMNFGSPYLGIMSLRKAYMRKMPGRIVGQTTDVHGKRAWVLTLSAREQHIRREKATSNICSNQGINTLIAACYMALLGKKGFREVALQCAQKAHYLYEKILEIDGFEKMCDAPFWMEFPVQSKYSGEEIQKALYEQGIHGGLSVQEAYPELGNTVLFAITEKRTKEEMDRLIEVLRGLK